MKSTPARTSPGTSHWTRCRVVRWSLRFALFLPALTTAASAQPLPKADGYRGIWYMNQPSDDEYRYKYSGGMATGKEWEFHPITTSDYNYDHGSLYIESDNSWQLIAPTAPGPQPYGTGGEMVLWSSRDAGRSWTKVKQLTHDSPRNHTYARRPVHAHPDCYALWADGNARQPSESSLYFTNRTGDHVWRLPRQMTDYFARPEIVR